jgi:hypothetical protein
MSKVTGHADGRRRVVGSGGFAFRDFPARDINHEAWRAGPGRAGVLGVCRSFILILP